MAAKQNVLQMIDTFNQGGSERQMVQLTRLLKESGRYNIHAACLGGERGPLRAEMEAMGFRVIPSFPLTSFYDRNAALQLRRFAAYLKEHEIDLVHVHDFYTNIFGMAGAAFARVTARIASRRETDGIRSGAQRWTERRAYNLAHAVVANAEAVRRQLIGEGVRPEKIVTVYNGTDLDRVAPPATMRRDEALAHFNLPGEQDGRRQLISLVANMKHPMKDQETFLRAARRVRTVVPSVVFVLAGEGPRLGHLRDLASELDLEGHALFIGRYAEVAELLAISEVGVLSSKGVEGFSNSIIEYMAAARPVVATDVGGAREAVADGETGFIVKAEDDEAMAARLIELLTQPERARDMGARGRADVERKFSCAAQLETTENLYERLLARKRSVALTVANEKTAA